MSTDVESLAEPLRSRVRALLAAADGRVIIVSARRTRDEQIALRRMNCGDSEYDIFRKPSGECNPETARPGESKHETGQAVDLGGDLALADKLAPLYGMRRSVEGENWHFEAKSGGIDIPGAGVVSDVIGGASDAVSSVLGWKDAISKFVEVLTRKETWLRVIGALVGLVLVILGASLIMGDLGVIDGKGAASLMTGVDE